MDYRKETIIELKEYGARKQSIERLNEKIESLESRQLSLGGMSDCEPIQDSNMNKQEDRIINIIYELGKTKELLKDNKTMIRRLECGLDFIDETQKRILDRFYINPVSDRTERISRLKDELGYEKTKIYEEKDKALRNLTLALYGTVDR